jgi:hypothetical protein
MRDCNSAVDPKQVALAWRMRNFRCSARGMADGAQRDIERLEFRSSTASSRQRLEKPDETRAGRIFVSSLARPARSSTIDRCQKHGLRAASPSAPTALDLIKCNPLPPMGQERPLPIHRTPGSEPLHVCWKGCEGAEAILPTGLILQEPPERQGTSSTSSLPGGSPRESVAAQRGLAEECGFSREI